MVILKLKLDNILLFDNFELNLSYPKKIVNSSIKNENLAGKPNFRYKKLVVLTGANATGKTALGRILMALFNFIDRKEYGFLIHLIEDRKKEAHIEMDFVPENDKLYRAIINIIPSLDGSYTRDCFSSLVGFETIKPTDNYEKCSERLSKAMSSLSFNSDYIQELEKIPRLSWMFEFPFASDGMQKRIHSYDPEYYCKNLKTILHILDPRITDVKRIENSDDSFSIIRNGSLVILEKGKINHPEELSSGTQEGIGFANLLTTIKRHSCGFYYCDEKFSHIHTELEKSFLSLMVDLIGDNEQLFFTTHNTDILGMDLPLHSFAFLKRDEYNNNAITCVFASDYIKKNNVSLKTAVENDMFSSNPNVPEVLSILDI